MSGYCGYPIRTPCSAVLISAITLIYTVIYTMIYAVIGKKV